MSFNALPPSLHPVRASSTQKWWKDFDSTLLNRVKNNSRALEGWSMCGSSNLKHSENRVCFVSSGKNSYLTSWTRCHVPLGSFWERSMRRFLLWEWSYCSYDKRPGFHWLSYPWSRTLDLTSPLDSYQYKGGGEANKDGWLTFHVKSFELTLFSPSVDDSCSLLNQVPFLLERQCKGKWSLLRTGSISMLLNSG